MKAVTKKGKAKRTMKKLTALLASSIAALCAASMIYASPASATNEYYPHFDGSGCGKCASTSALANIGDNYLVNKESFHYSGNGLCDAAYLSNGSRVFNKCKASPYNVILVCYNYGEFYGYGQARRYYKEYTYNLAGREDNFKYCG